MTDRSHSPYGRAPSLSRRSLLHTFGAALAALPLSRMLGCSSDGAVTPGDAATGDAAADAITTDAVTTADAASSDVVTDVATSARWATGGTAAMTAAATYPNPFTSGAGTACSLICETTIGPCHTTSAMRRDVSDGLDGLPVRLALRLVDEACAPVQNAIVEIWHTKSEGVYSGNISTMCNSSAADRAAQFFRGYLRTDADGRVDFDTCFPGWYSGRAVHIHVRVMTGDYAASDTATATVITQLFFPEQTTQQIFAAEPLYATRGQPDTTLATDNVIGGTTDRSPYTVDVARMSDGVMLASKTLVVRGAGSSTSLCAAQGAGGMMGGPPGDGGMMGPPRDA